MSARFHKPRSFVLAYSEAVEGVRDTRKMRSVKIFKNEMRIVMRDTSKMIIVRRVTNYMMIVSKGVQGIMTAM